MRFIFSFIGKEKFSTMKMSRFQIAAHFFSTANSLFLSNGRSLFSAPHIFRGKLGKPGVIFIIVVKGFCGLVQFMCELIFPEFIQQIVYEF